MLPVAMVRANALLPFVGFLEGNGAPVERLLDDVGLTPDATADGERLLPLYACLSFLARAAKSEKLPELGLVVGQQTPFEHLGAYARLIRRGETVEQTLNALIGAVALHNSGDRLWLSRCGERVALCHRFAPPLSAGWLQGEMFTVTMMIQAVRATVGPGWAPEHVRLPADAAALQKRVEATLQAPVVCAGDTTAVAFPRLLLAAPNRGLRPGGEDADDAISHEAVPAADFAGSVRQTIRALLSAGHPDIHRTATAVGLSARTLQRRLAEVGETYSSLVDRARFEASVRHLREGDSKLIDIASELGYADPANFTRAFRRWAGMPPRAFRRNPG